MIAPSPGRHTGNPPVAGVQVRLVPTVLGTHLASTIVAGSRRTPTVNVLDLAHIAPWLGPRIRASNSLVYFRHLHRRTVYQQLRFPLNYLADGVERLYPLIYPDYTFVTETRTSHLDLASIGVPSSHVTVIPPGVDRSIFRPGRRADNPLLVHFAGLRPYKRPELAIRALALVRQMGFDARLAMVGSNSEAAKSLRQIAKHLGIQDWVSFPGRLSDTELAELVTKSWTNLQCSVAEGWGLSVSESAAAGVPTVGFQVPGVTDTVRNGNVGIVVPDHDLDAFAKAICAVLSDVERWRETCLSSPIIRDWDDVTADWEDLIKAIGSG